MKDASKKQLEYKIECPHSHKIVTVDVELSLEDIGMSITDDGNLSEAGRDEATQIESFWVLESVSECPDCGEPIDAECTPDGKVTLTHEDVSAKQ